MSFEYFPKLPPKIRLMIIDKMNPKDRLQFRKCSKLCSKEVKISKNYCYGLEWNSRTFSLDKLPTIVLRFYYDCNIFDTLKIVLNHLSEKCIKFKTFSPNPKEPIKSFGKKFKDEDEISIHKYAQEVFIKKFRKYQGAIKKLVILGDSFPRSPIFTEKIENLEYLEYLHCDGYKNFMSFTKLREIFSKIGDHRKLKGLRLEKFRATKKISKLSRIYDTQDILYLDFNLSDYRKITTVAAKNISIPIGKWKPEHIFEFFKNWHHGKLDAVQNFQWRIGDYEDFDIEKVFDLLEIKRVNEYYKSHTIGHEFDEKKNAIIIYKLKSLEALRYIKYLTFHVFEGDIDDLDSVQRDRAEMSDFFLFFHQGMLTQSIFFPDDRKYSFEF
ncbi:unnamed protein product [Caenorhabditis angaria]|uniref:F-box domain-containing protein n=1 Tax=Caenorhabditis angaria TaxID=860376 RepID=A0A9P1N5B6_9PELO|nr:unnamed protein product [Caenorhabditis angaria]